MPNIEFDARAAHGPKDSKGPSLHPDFSNFEIRVTLGGVPNGTITAAQEVEIRIDGAPAYLVTCTVEFLNRGKGSWVYGGLSEKWMDPLKVLTLPSWLDAEDDDAQSAVGILRALYKPEVPADALTALWTETLEGILKDLEDRVQAAKNLLKF